MKASIISLTFIISLAMALPKDLKGREPIVCIGCINQGNCDEGCFNRPSIPYDCICPEVTI